MTEMSEESSDQLGAGVSGQVKGRELMRVTLLTTGWLVRCSGRKKISIPMREVGGLNSLYNPGEG